MQSDTPRTDAHYATTKTAWPTQSDIDFARTLERENARLSEELEAWQNAFEQWGVDPETARAAVEKFIADNLTPKPPQ
jgi:DNA/RNA-binding domain of Phe-tRNA-synthetase-like protein